jgi:hypothetical protein
MLADLDLLLIAVFCTADDLLPKRTENARRSVTDAEVVTLCVAQALLSIPSDRRFLAVAQRRLGHLFPRLPQQPGFHKRRRRLADVIEALIAEFARHSPGWDDDLLIVDSTPVECARSIETVRRSQLADAADYGYCRSHSRFFWGFRLHGLFALDGTPRAVALTSPKRDERDVCLDLLARCPRHGQLTVIGDKGYASREFAADAERLGARIVRPRRKDEAGRGPHLAPVRQRIESIFWTAKDLLALERHGARTLHGLRARIAQRLLALAACVALNHRLNRPSRSLSAYYA